MVCITNCGCKNVNAEAIAFALDQFCTVIKIYAYYGCKNHIAVRCRDNILHLSAFDRDLSSL